ncbi:MAG: electron transport complex subunit RsxC [Clostridiales bacterium]|nr:electron transport complex subunit RsxC [Clostridiales bacterium]
MMRTFRRGIHPLENKLTADIPLQEFPTPDKVYIPLSQHIGAPAEAIVKEGDEVKCGTLIAAAKGNMSACVHSSVSGTVLGIVQRTSARGTPVPHVCIQNDGRYEQERLNILENPSREEIIERIKEAGIVGMGGATFPTHIKYQTTKKIDTLIINASECEPYLTCDHRLMLDETDEFLRGVVYLKKAADAARAVIGVEKNKKDAYIKLKEKAAGLGIDVRLLKTKYPQGSEKQLIYAITRRFVPTCGLPSDIGVIVSNVHTAYSLCRAIELGEPCYKRAVTVSGGGVEQKGNFFIRIGVPYGYIYEKLRGNMVEDDTHKILVGGPMMGIALHSLEPVTTKGASGVLFLTDKEFYHEKETQCINCASCVRSCPMNLMPLEIEACILGGQEDRLEKYHVQSCVECGACAYVCPAKRPLLQAIRLAKQTIAKRRTK